MVAQADLGPFKTTQPPAAQKTTITLPLQTAAAPPAKAKGKA